MQFVQMLPFEFPKGKISNEKQKHVLETVSIEETLLFMQGILGMGPASLNNFVPSNF